MAELTEEHLAAIMNTAETVRKMANSTASLVEDIREMGTDVRMIRTTIDMQTTTIRRHQQKNPLTLTTTDPAVLARLERYEKFMDVVAEKLQLDVHALD